MSSSTPVFVTRPRLASRAHEWTPEFQRAKAGDDVGFRAFRAHYETDVNAILRPFPPAEHARVKAEVEAVFRAELGNTARVSQFEKRFYLAAACRVHPVRVVGGSRDVLVQANAGHAPALENLRVRSLPHARAFLRANAGHAPALDARHVEEAFNRALKTAGSVHHFVNHFNAHLRALADGSPAPQPVAPSRATSVGGEGEFTMPKAFNARTFHWAKAGHVGAQGRALSTYSDLVTDALRAFARHPRRLDFHEAASLQFEKALAESQTPDEFRANARKRIDASIANTLARFSA